MAALLFEISDFGAVDEFHCEHLGGSRVPVDLRYVDIRPVFKTFMEPLGISTLGGVVHFLMNGHIKLSQHPGPIGVFVQLREPLGKLGDLFENDYVTLDRRFEIGPLYLNGDLFAGMKPGSIDLSE